MWKLYCDDCERRFTISEDDYDKFISDMDFLMHCTLCGSTEVNLVDNFYL